MWINRLTHRLTVSDSGQRIIIRLPLLTDLFASFNVQIYTGQASPHTKKECVSRFTSWTNQMQMNDPRSNFWKMQYNS
jgi:hypothetical protein